MNNSLRNYIPGQERTLSEGQTHEIPEGYQHCNALKTGEAKLSQKGYAITCTADCPYGHKTNGHSSWEGEQARYFCGTKGLVSKEDLRKEKGRDLVKVLKKAEENA